MIELVLRSHATELARPPDPDHPSRAGIVAIFEGTSRPSNTTRCARHEAHWTTTAPSTATTPRLRLTARPRERLTPAVREAGNGSGCFRMRLQGHWRSWNGTNILKQWRSITTRYDKHNLNYRGGVVANAIILWLRQLRTRPQTL